METIVDLQALQGFLEESKDSLLVIEADFVELERQPDNSEIINRIFRPVHSLKGNSGFFGLSNINMFAHQLEDVFDQLRNGDLRVDKDIINILFTGVDYLHKMLDRAFDDPDDVELRSEEEAFLREKVEPCKSSGLPGDVQVLIDFERNLSQADKLGLNIFEEPLILTAFAQVQEANHHLLEQLKGQSSAQDDRRIQPDLIYHFGEQDLSLQIGCLAEIHNTLIDRTAISQEQGVELRDCLSELADAMIGEFAVGPIIGEVRSMATFFDDPLMLQSNEFIDTVSGFIHEIVSRCQAKSGTDPELLGEILLEQNLVSEEQIQQALGSQRKLGEILVDQGALHEDELKKALTKQNTRVLDKHLKQGGRAESAKTIRIDQSKLDIFANSVGELYISIDSFNFLRKQLMTGRVDIETFSKFTKTITLLDDLVAKLQDNVMSIRRLPVRNLFQRFPRLIRQLAASLERQVDFRVNGENTVIDKDLLENIENPLVHLLRNAVDHGIESPEARLANGKKAHGSLSLSATADEHNVFITIQDDGKGIDPIAIKETAIRTGVLTPAAAEAMSDKELIKLIFRPGFSSAETVSDVSGRGVGMDVVQSVLLRNNGTIEVDSTVGQGTCLTIKIPLTRTLVTAEALIVQSSEQFFAIPSEEISTVIYPEERVVPLLGGRSGISYQGEVIRLVDVNQFYYATPQALNEFSKDQVIVVCAKQQVGLLVDRVFKHQQIVVKLFDKGYRQF